MVGRLAIIYSLLFSFTSFGQKKNEVKLTVDPIDAEVNGVVTITVKTNVQGEIDVENLPGCFMYGYNIQQYSESQMDYNTGAVINYRVVSQTGSFGKAGKYTIGPAYVKSGNRVYKSNTVTVTVGQKIPMNMGTVTAQQLNAPAFGVVQTSKTSIYEGEPLIVSAKIYSRFNPSHLNNYQQYSMKGAVERHPLGTNHNIKVTTEKFKGLLYHTFDYDRQIIFPPGTGQFRIDPFRMFLHQDFDRFRIISSGSVVNIKPLPANPPADFIGGVGTFSVSRKVDTIKIKQGEVFQMQVTIKGAGNLQNTLKPVLNLPKGFIVYGDPVVTDNISFGVRGAEGIISYDYNIQVSKYGTLAIPPTTITYFDPEKGKYVQVSTSDDEIIVERDKSILVETPEDKSSEPEEIKDVAKLRSNKDVRSGDSLFGSPLFWSGVGAPLCGALIFLLITGRREKSEEKIEAKQTVQRKDKELGDYVAKTTTLAANNDRDQFFLHVEATLKKAFELTMKRDHVLNKQDIYSFLQSKGNHQLNDRVRKLFAKCEESRYGFSSSEEPLQYTLNELNDILSQLKA